MKRQGLRFKVLLRCLSRTLVHPILAVLCLPGGGPPVTPDFQALLIAGLGKAWDLQALQKKRLKTCFCDTQNCFRLFASDTEIKGCLR